jgi:hypothetical protein
LVYESAGPSAERTAPTLFTVDFGCAGCRRGDRWRDFAVLREADLVRAEVVRPRLRLLVPFRLLVLLPDADRLARDSGFLLAIIRLPSCWACAVRTRTRCKETAANPRGINTEGAYRRWRCPA